MRRVVQESASGGSNESHKVKTWLQIRVEKVDADLKAASLRANGRNIRENEHVKMGGIAASALGKSEVAAVVIQEGTAIYCVINDKGDVRILDRVEQALPKKKLGSTSKMDSAVDKFYSNAIDKLKEIFEMARLKSLVLAGPGIGKDELYKRLIDFAVKSEDKEIMANKSKIIKLTISACQPTALSEILKEPKIALLLADTKSAQESKLLDVLHKGINEESGLSIYGIKPVEKATDQGAIKALLLSDSLFRSSDLKTRKHFATIVDTVKKNGGQLYVVSSGSETDERLMKLTGVAAILHFPLFEE